MLRRKKINLHPKEEWGNVPISKTRGKDRARQFYRDHIQLGNLEKRLNTVVATLHGAIVKSLKSRDAGPGIRSLGREHGEKIYGTVEDHKLKLENTQNFLIGESCQLFVGRKKLGTTGKVEGLHFISGGNRLKNMITTRNGEELKYASSSSALCVSKPDTYTDSAADKSTFNYRDIIENLDEDEEESSDVFDYYDDISSVIDPPFLDTIVEISKFATDAITNDFEDTESLYNIMLKSFVTAELGLHAVNEESDNNSIGDDGHERMCKKVEKLNGFRKIIRGYYDQIGKENAVLVMTTYIKCLQNIEKIFTQAEQGSADQGSNPTRNNFMGFLLKTGLEDYAGVGETAQKLHTFLELLMKTGQREAIGETKDLVTVTNTFLTKIDIPENLFQKTLNTFLTSLQCEMAWTQFINGNKNVEIPNKENSKGQTVEDVEKKLKSLYSLLMLLIDYIFTVIYQDEYVTELININLIKDYTSNLDG